MEQSTVHVKPKMLYLVVLHVIVVASGKEYGGNSKHCNKAVYGEFHPGRELTAIEMENFWFAVKPISVLIYLKDFCAFVYVSIFLGKRSSSILFTSFTCWTCLKWPLNLAMNEKYVFWGTFERSLL